MQIKNQINISQCTFFRRLLNRLSRLARGSADFCVSLSANYAHSFSSIYRSSMCDFFEKISQGGHLWDSKIQQNIFFRIIYIYIDLYIYWFFINLRQIESLDMFNIYE